MRVTPLEPLGARVHADLTLLTDADVDELRQRLAEHGVLVLAGQEVDDADFLAFLQRFGDLTFTPGEVALDDFPELNVVSNVGRTRPPRSQFHVDTSYVAEPPAYTALRAVRIPVRGGQTVFSDQRRAYDTLDPATREQLAGRSVRHVVTGVADDVEGETEAWHPLFRPHPLTGRIALYLSTPARCAEVSGLDDAETVATVRALLEHSTREDNLLRHSWSPGDVVIWDNACVMHKADHSDVVGDRVLHRGLVARHERSD